MIDKSFQALIISLGIHLLLFGAFRYLPDQKFFDIPTPVEILYNNSSEGSQRIVMDDSAGPKEEDLAERLKEQVKNLSRVTKRVQEEQVARPQPNPISARDLVPRLTPPNPSLQAEHKGNGGQGDSGEAVDSRPFPIEPGLGSPKPLGTQGDFSKTIAIGGDTSGEWIPGVKEGSFTALNTDQFTFYSFFERIRNSVRFRWIQGVRAFSQQASMNEINTLAKIPSPTQLEISLNRTGDVLKIAVLKTSGSADLDEAAIQAFWRASPLNNPPAEMVEEDGLIRLYYSFQVFWHTRYMATGK